MVKTQAHDEDVMKTQAHGEDMMKTQAHDEDMMKTQAYVVLGGGLQRTLGQSSFQLYNPQTMSNTDSSTGLHRDIGGRHRPQKAENTSTQLRIHSCYIKTP
ncbi:hypothetical protein F7725_009689 [Dissostichus mawsoni]|uniref:Uncharacterized protein n=1 Tax=Dissostichus mawsoni TaxID=36200 RepID=A0A7J5XLT3_DISMA|nr:hypothetical protein F7725_009689 [Dissostichus mawsoni]